RSRPDLLHRQAEVDALRIADLAEVTTGDFGDHTDRGQVAGVHTSRLGQVRVDRGVDELEIAGVVHVAVHVVVGPARGRYPPRDVVGTGRARLPGRHLRRALRARLEGHAGSASRRR